LTFVSQSKIKEDDRLLTIFGMGVKVKKMPKNIIKNPENYQLLLEKTP